MARDVRDLGPFPSMTCVGLVSGMGWCLSALSHFSIFDSRIRRVWVSRRPFSTSTVPCF